MVAVDRGLQLEQMREAQVTTDNCSTMYKLRFLDFDKRQNYKRKR